MLPFEHLATGFSPINLRACAAASALAYKDERLIAAECACWGFDRFRFIENQTLGAECFIAGNSKMILVVFRGTDELSDWISDLDCELVNLFNLRLHEGFYDQLRSVWVELNNTLAEFRNNAQRIWLTGHSLGGALAALAALLLLKIEARYIAGGYTFGQPRVGNLAFAREFNAALKPHFFRVVNEEDVVARLPRLAMVWPPAYYHHAGTEVFFDSRGAVHFDLPWWKKIPSDISGWWEEWRLGKSNLLTDHSLDDYGRKAVEV